MSLVPVTAGSQPSDSRPRYMKRKHDLESACDRAQKHRKPGLLRIHLDMIGFWPDNRGRIGICSHHTHEVAWDCVADKTKLRRYQHADLVAIPSGLLVLILDANRNRCATDALMPRFSEN